MLSQHQGQLAEAAAEAGDSLLVVIGGDGTVNEVVNGVAGTEAEIAVLPGGGPLPGRRDRACRNR